MKETTLSSCVYSPLMEEPENSEGWGKQTVQYALKHSGRIKRLICAVAKGMNRTFQKSDIDDCFQEVLVYLHNTKDYDVSIASERSTFKPDGTGVGSIISLEAYTFSCAKYVTLRFVSDRISIEVSETAVVTKIDDDGTKLDLFEQLPDESSKEDFISMEYDLEKICEMHESERYKYDIDFYELWFIKLLSIKYNKRDLYTEILAALSISNRDMTRLENKVNMGGLMLDIAKAISICGTNKALEIMRGYVYSADKIERVAQLIA
jgi:hypothetical protein